MNQGRPTELNSAGAELNVTIASDSHETITAALDEAVERLNMVTSTAVPPEPSRHSEPSRQSKVIDASVVLCLIQSICRAQHRRDALTELVNFLDARTTDCSIRGGMGDDRLHRIYDPRLGWLATESSLFDPLCRLWDSEKGTKISSNDSAVTQTPSMTMLDIRAPEGTGRCVVWIDGPPGQRDSLHWLSPSANAIGSALWSRPGRSWPNRLTRIAQRRKAAVALAGALFVGASLWPVSYRVSCHSRVETTAQRLIATPFEATLERAQFKPGDTVNAGDVLLVLDGRPLRLEREVIEAERQQVSKERDAALATGRIAESQQADLKTRQLSRRFDLLSDRLQNLEVVSPIDGVVVSGDLDRFIGSPLEQGQTLMEIAPMGQMVIEIEIPEYEIGYVEQGAQTRIKIDALGGRSLRVAIDDIYPRAELRDDRNVFIAKIVTDNTDRTLKPGMMGKATLYGPLRPWLWSWIRGGFEQLLWSIGY